MNYLNQTKKDWWIYGIILGIWYFLFKIAIGKELFLFSWLNIFLGIIIPLFIIFIISIVTYKTYKIREVIAEKTALLESIEKSKKHDLTNQIKLLKNKNESLLNKQKKKKQVYDRFEDVIKKGRKNFQSIAINYNPFFYRGKEQTTGIGYDLIESIFSPFSDIKFQKFSNTNQSTYNWESILETFNDRNNKIDFIFTPLYETRSRLYKYDIVYSTPLFYSSFGLYMRKDDFESGKTYAKIAKDKVGYSELKDLFTRKVFNELKFKFLKGEISELLKSKITRTPLQAIPATIFTDDEFEEMLVNVGDSSTEGDVVFMEVFKAEKIIKRKKITNLINILDEHSLVYPVGLVFRKEETVLRNFVNLRITELKMNGLMQKIINENAKDYGLQNQTEIDRAFIQKYDFSKIDSNYNDSEILFSEKLKNEYDTLEDIYGNYISFQKNISSIIKEFRPNEKLNILEIGYGSGITTKIIAESLTYDSVINILDNDKDMERISKNNRALKSLNLNYFHKDISRFLEQYEGEPFDLIISAYTIHNFSNKYREKLYKLLYKNMSKNSLLINADKYANHDLNDRIDALNFRINKYTNYLKENPDKNDFIEEWVAHYVKDQSNEFVMIKDDALTKLKESGFSEKNLKIEVPAEINEIEMMAILTAYKKE